MGSNPAGRTTHSRCDPEMFILRLLILVFVWLLIRQLWRAYLVASRPKTVRRENKEDREDLGNLTQQEISDAEFEELEDD